MLLSILTFFFCLFVGDFELTFSRSHSISLIYSCSNAISLGSSFFPPKIIDGSNENGVKYSQESCGIFDTYPLIWYVIEPSKSSSITVSTCNEYTNFDTYISILNGTCGDLDCVAYNDDACESSASTVTFTPEIGETYYIALFGYLGATGEYQLTVSQQVDIECADHPVIILSSRINNVTNISNRDLPALPQSYCAFETGPAYWMPFYPTNNGILEITTCDSDTTFNTYLSCYSGTCSDLICVSYNDDDASCSFNVDFSSLYLSVRENELIFIVLTGKNGRTGNAALHYTFTPI